jgi:ferredoxin
LAKLPTIIVALCACHGRIADRLSLGDIGHFLQGMAPDTQVVVSDDLCQRDAIHRLVDESRSQALVIGACSQLRPEPYFWEDMPGNISRNPYSMRVVDLLEEVSVSYTDTELIGRVELLLWAQVRRLSESKQVGKDNLKLGLSIPSYRVTRRELLAATLPRYEIIPSIRSLECAGGDKCRLCRDICPSRAVIIEGDTAAIDSGRCCGCGACVVVCPHRAIYYPSFSLDELDNELEGLLDEGVLLEPRMIALTCQNCLPERGIGVVSPPNMLSLKVPCLAAASPWLMLRAFDMGAQGLALISSGDKCQAKFDVPVWQDNVQFVQAVLECWGISLDRVRFFGVTEANRDEIEAELRWFASKVAELGPTPLRIGDRTSVSTEGLPLPALIQAMGNKLVGSSAGSISTDAVPFGKVTLDYKRCTGCGLCAFSCPTGALTHLMDDGVGYQLLFLQGSCIACGVCIGVCPEGCLELQRILEMDRIGHGALALFHDRLVSCCRCGGPVAPESMINRLRSKLQEAGSCSTDQLELCPACKTGTIRY